VSPAPRSGLCFQCGLPLPADHWWGSLGLSQGARFCSEACFKTYEPSWTPQRFEVLEGGRAHPLALAVVTLLLWCLLAALPLWLLGVPEPVPCSTDQDCCIRNPRICAEVDPELFRTVWGGR
jgi:hypothetical protein